MLLLTLNGFKGMIREDINFKILKVGLKLGTVDSMVLIIIGTTVLKDCKHWDSFNVFKINYSLS